MDYVTLPYITKEFIAQFLPDNPIIVEAGAHKGKDTIEMAKLWPHGRIHAFEPIPALFEQLQKNTESIENITCYNVALADKDGMKTFYASETLDSLGSLLEPAEILKEKPSARFSETTVPTITLDTWAQENKISQVDFIWLDTQGSELSILHAAPMLLKKVNVLHIEVNITERYKNIPHADTIKEWLEKQGFCLKALALYRKHWGNALYVRL